MSKISHKLAETRSEISELWAQCAALRREISVPGFWDSLADNCEQWADDVSVSPFWKAVAKNQPTWSNEFSQLTTGSLLASPVLPKFQGKGSERIKTKSLELLRQKPRGFELFRGDGAPVPQLNDLVRARVECQFLDGVEFFADRIEKLASNQMCATT